MYPSAAICLHCFIARSIISPTHSNINTALHTEKQAGICGVWHSRLYPTTITNLLPKLLTPTTFPDKLWLPQRTDTQTPYFIVLITGGCSWYLLMVRPGLGLSHD